MKHNLFFAVTLIAATFIAGCASNRTLDPVGVYQGDALLWHADGVIVEVDAAYDTMEQLAARNPEFVSTSPELQTVLARIAKERDGVPGDDELLTNLIRTRDAYASLKLPDNATALQKQLGIARTLLDQARTLLPAVTQ